MKYFFIISHSICLFFILLFNNVKSQNPLPLIKNYSTEQYKGGIQNWQIEQDQNGIIYVANNFGLLQYDGNSWKTYSISAASKLRSIALGSDGKVFAGCQGDFGYFEADDLGVLNYHSLRSILPEEHQNIGEAWKVYIINNEVYFCTFNKIYIYSNDNIRVIESKITLDVSSLRNNKIYPHVPGVGLHVLESTKIKLLPFGTFFQDKVVSSIITSNNNGYLIATSRHGIFKVRNNNIKPWNTDLNKLFEETFINQAIVLKNGDLVIGTQHNGVYIVDQAGNIKLNLNKTNGLNSRTILSLFEDQNDNLWVGQNNGISFVELKSPFLLMNEESGLPGTGYSALKNDDQLFLGTNNGAYLNQKNEIKLIPNTEGQVHNLQFVNNDIILSHHSGGFRINGNQSEKLNEGGTWFYQEYNNYIIKGTYVGIEILNKENYSYVDRISNLNESSRIIAIENDSILWMSHGYRGLFRIKLKKGSLFDSEVDFYDDKNGLPSELFNSAFMIEGRLKIATESGIYIYDRLSKSFKLDKELNKYFGNDPVLTLESDMYGNIYFMTTNEVGFLEKLRSNEYIRHTSEFNSIRQLLNDDLPNINIIGPNKVLFGAKEGFILFDRKEFGTSEKEKFKALIRQVHSIGDEIKLLYGGNMSAATEVSLNGEENYPELFYKDNTITFEFSSTTFSTTTSPHFQYKLIGYDRDWQKWTQNNFKEYTNLREGFYTFQIRSKNANNIESEIESYSFIIIYPWYRSPIAYIIYVILIIFSIIGLIVNLDRKHELDKKKLEQKRIEEVSQKEMEIDNVTRISENKINQLHNEKLESELQHKNTELATNTMHLLTKNEFISGVKSNLNSVVKKSTNNDVKIQISKIIKEIEANIKTDGEWEHFQIHFDKVHGDFTKRFQEEFEGLSPQDIKLSAYLRLNLSTKEIANLLNISVRGVEISRYRLRKKLALDRSQNLTEFILNY